MVVTRHDQLAVGGALAAQEQVPGAVPQRHRPPERRHRGRVDHDGEPVAVPRAGHHVLLGRGPPPQHRLVPADHGGRVAAPQRQPPGGGPVVLVDEGPQPAAHDHGVAVLGPLDRDLLVTGRVPVLRLPVREGHPHPGLARDLDVQVPLDAAVVHAGAADVGAPGSRADVVRGLGPGAAAIGPADLGGQDAQRHSTADPRRATARPVGVRRPPPPPAQPFPRLASGPRHRDGGEPVGRGALRPGQQQLSAGLRAHPLDVHVDQQLAPGVPAPAQHGGGPGHPHPQPPAHPPGAEPDPGRHLQELGALGGSAHRRVQPGGPPHAVPADQHVTVPLAGEPAAAGPEPARADLAAEPRPVVQVPGLPGPDGGLGMPQRAGRHHDRQPPAPGRAQDDDLGRVPAPGDVDGRHERAPGEDQPPVMPADALHPDERVEFPPVGPVDPGRYLQPAPVGPEREIRADPAAPADHRRRLDRLVGLPGVELEQLLPLSRREQVVGELVGGRQPREHPPVDLLQVPATERHELVLVVVAGPGQVADVQPEVVDQRLALVLAQQPGRGPLAQEAVDVEQRGDPVAEVADVGPRLGDRQRALAALPPVVDRVRDHVHGPGQHVRPGHGLEIFPGPDLGKGHALGVPE